jgi:hypothetical protein
MTPSVTPVPTNGTGDGQNYCRAHKWLFVLPPDRGVNTEEESCLEKHVVHQLTLCPALNHACQSFEATVSLLGDSVINACLLFLPRLIAVVAEG